MHLVRGVIDLFMCLLALYKSSSWHKKKWTIVRLTAFFSLSNLKCFHIIPPWMVGTENNFNCGPLDNSLSPTMYWIYVLQIQSQCVINFRLSPGLPHNHKWIQWNTVHPAICIADKTRRMKTYNDDNGGLFCVTNRELTLSVLQLD